MASPNLELVRSIWAAWEGGDYGSAEWADPGIEFVIADGPAPGEWTGLEGLADGFRNWASAWEDFRQLADEYQELDGERVLVLDHFSARGKRSGLDVGRMSTKGAVLFHVRDGKVTRIALYLDRERALANLGLTAG